MGLRLDRLLRRWNGFFARWSRGATTAAPAKDSRPPVALVAVDPSTALERAIEAFRLKRWLEALRIVDGILTAAPASRLALAIGARAANQTANPAAAARYARRLVQLDPRQHEGHGRHAAGPAKPEELPEGLSLVDELLASQPEASALLTIKLEALVRLGDSNRVIAFVTGLQGRAWQPDDAPLMLRIAQFLFENEEAETAAEWLDRIEQLGAETADSIQLRARIAHRLGLFDKLRALCARLETIGSQRQQFEAHLLRARAAQAGQDMAAAVGFYEAALRLRPNHEESAAYLVNVHLKSGNLAGAEAAIAAFRPDQSAQPEQLWWMIQLHDAKGEAEPCLTLLRDGVDRFAGNTRFMTNAVNFLADRDELAEALRATDLLLAEKPRSDAPLRMKLQLLQRLGDETKTAAFLAELRARGRKAADAPLAVLVAQSFFHAAKYVAAAEWLDHAARLDPTSSDVTQWRARIAYAERRYADVAELCAELENTGNRQQQFHAHLLRARAAHNSGDAAAALRFFAEAYALRPEHEESAAYLIPHYLAAGDIRAAEAVLEDFPDQAQSRPARQWWQILVHEAKGETQQAQGLVLQGIEKFSEDARFLANAANFLIEHREIEQALRLAERLLENQPTAVPLLRLKLNALTQLRDTERIAAFAEALRRREWVPRDAALVRQLAHMFFEAGNSPTAAEWLDLAEGLRPETAETVHLRARILFAERRYGELARICARLEEIGSPQQQFEAFLLPARAAHNSGDPAGAIPLYREAYRRRPNHEESAGYLVQRYLALHDAASAERVVADFTGGHNTLAVRRWWQALIHDAKGERPEAMALLRSGLDRFPDNTRYRVNVAGFLIDRDELAEAAQILEVGLQRSPRALPLLIRLMQCRLRADKPDASVLTLCDQILELDPRHQDALLQRGNILTRLARRRDALAAYVEGTRLFPTNTTFWRSAVSTSVMLGEEGGARAILEQARSAFADASGPHLVALADIFEAADAEAEALYYAAEALRIDPDLGSAQQIAARLYTNYGYFDRAWPLLLRLQEPADRHIRTVQIWAQVAAGRHAAHRLGANTEDGRYPETLFFGIARASRQGRLLDDAGDRKSRSGIVHVISTLAAGGSERQLAATVTGLAAASDVDEEVSLAVEDLNPVYGRDFFLPQIGDSGIDIRWLDEERLNGRWRDGLAARPGHRDAVQAIASMPTEIVKLALPLYWVLIEKRPRAVHLWQDTVCIAGGIAAMLAGVPCIVMNTRSTRPIERQRARRYLHAGFTALLSRPGTLLLNNSRAGASDYEDWLGLPAGTVQVLHNGYDFAAIRGRADDVETARIRTELRIPTAAPVLGGVMRCSFEKRPELWTETAIWQADNIADCHAILVGDGPMLPQLRERVKQAGHDDRIHFVGQRSPVEPWMRAMDVLFLSSLTEGMPNVLIEAQALGVPVATMRVGGAPETMAPNKTGIVLDEGPIAAIAGPIADLLQDRERRERLAEYSPHWVETEFGIDMMLRRLMAFYRTCSEAAPRPAPSGPAVDGTQHLQSVSPRRGSGRKSRRRGPDTGVSTNLPPA